jgi:hypothetical protein
MSDGEPAVGIIGAGQMGAPANTANRLISAPRT